MKRKNKRLSTALEHVAEDTKEQRLLREAEKKKRVAGKYKPSRHSRQDFRSRPAAGDSTLTQFTEIVLGASGGTQPPVVELRI